MERVVQGSGSDNLQRPSVQSQRMSSKDDYIAQLEAQLRILKSASAKGSSSHTLLRTNSPVRRHKEYDRGLVRNKSIQELNDS